MLFSQGDPVLSFGYFIMSNSSLPVAFESGYFRISFKEMLLAHACIHSFPPAFKAAALQFFPHKGDHFGFRQAKLKTNGFEGGSILPGHFNDAVDIVEVH